MVNSSKVKDPRFWNKWRESGAVGSVEKPYANLQTEDRHIYPTKNGRKLGFRSGITVEQATITEAYLGESGLHLEMRDRYNPSMTVFTEYRRQEDIDGIMRDLEAKTPEEMKGRLVFTAFFGIDLHSVSPMPMDLQLQKTGSQ